MNLVRTSALNVIAVIVRMLSLLGINKVLAIYVGPAGFAMVGQFYNAVQMITTFASGAINVGVVRFTAEHSSEEELQIRTWQTAGSIAFIGSIIFAIVLFIFNTNFAAYFLKDEKLGLVFSWFGGALLLFVFNTLLLAILNGKKEIKKYVVANIIGSILSLILTLWLAIQYRLVGALIALGTYQSLTFFLTLILCLRTDWFRLSYVFGRVDWSIAKKLTGYTAMALTSAIAVPISHILIRNYLGENLSWQAAGYWEAMWKFSSAYMLLFTSTLSVYFLPRISELKEPIAVRGELWSSLKIIFPFSLLAGVVAYLLRDWIILFLFTGEFRLVKDLFFWQLVGDTLKIVSWLLGFVYLAKGIIRYFIFAEIVSCALFYLFVRALTPSMGLEASALAHTLNYLCYLALVYLGLKKRGFVR
jgi:PST family polysaccharide transporter